jgi:hypothetical protein
VSILTRMAVLGLLIFLAFPGHAQIAIAPFEGDDDGYARQLVAESLAAVGAPLVRFSSVDKQLPSAVAPRDGLEAAGRELGVEMIIRGRVMPIPWEMRSALSPGETLAGLELEIVEMGRPETFVLSTAWGTGEDLHGALQLASFLIQPELFARIGSGGAVLVELQQAVQKWLGRSRLASSLPYFLGGGCILLGICGFVLSYRTRQRKSKRSDGDFLLHSHFEDQLRHPIYGEVTRLIAQRFLKRMEEHCGRTEIGAEELEAEYGKCMGKRNFLSRRRALRRFRKTARYVERGVFFGIDERRTWNLYRQLSQALTEIGISEPLLETGRDAH